MGTSSDRRIRPRARGTPTARRLSRSRARVKQLRRQAERQGLPPGSPLATAVDELEQMLDALSVAMEQLEVANQDLLDARHAAERHALRYRDLFESVPDAYVSTNELGVICDANRAAEAKLGREVRYLVGKPLLAFLAKEHREELEHQLLRIRNARQVRIGDWEPRFAPRNAAPFWAAVIAEASHEPDGTVAEVRWLLRDVTERRRAEEALRASEARLRLMADSVPVLIAYIDREERYRYNSAAYEAWFGIPPEKIWGQTVREVLGNAAYERVRGHIARALAGEQVRFEGEVPYALGGTRDVSIVYVPRVDESGEVVGFHALVSDVSEQRRMREKLRAAVAAAALAEDRERRRLAQDLHDDLGQLLSLACIKLGELRNTSGATDKVREIEKLISDAHGHTESLSFQLSPPILHDRGFVPATEWLAEDLTRNYGLRVEIEDDGEPKPLDEAARVALFRALRELLINVARHAGTGEAQVRIGRRGDSVHVEVRDHGLGFDPADTTGGFGLVSVRERLHNLGGRLEVESAPGEGARVIAEVPMRREEQS